MSTLGLVLAGGAARGGYAAGVLRYMFTELPKQLGHVPWPDVVSGTSVGALNGVFAVARSPQYMLRLAEIWQQLRIEHVYRLNASSLFTMLRSTFRPVERAALLDPSPLYDLVEAAFPHRQARRAIDSGATRAFIVSATQLATGLNVMFTDSADPELWLHPLPGARIKRTHVRPRHLLASAGLPFLFPPVTIDGRAYVDGGLRQNTPLRPVLQCGADRVLLIGALVSKEREALPAMLGVSPTLPFLAGKTLNALMLDPVERDLRHAEQINAILAWGSSRYGPGFAEGINKDLGLRPVRNFYLRPSEDLGRIAAATFKATPPPVSGKLARVLSMVADSSNDTEGESDFLSYLYFDREFTGQIEALGFEDARANEEALMRFLS